MEEQERLNRPKNINLQNEIDPSWLNDIKTSWPASLVFPCFQDLVTDLTICYIESVYSVLDIFIPSKTLSISF